MRNPTALGLNCTSPVTLPARVSQTPEGALTARLLSPAAASEPKLGRFGCRAYLSGLGLSCRRGFQPVALEILPRPRGDKDFLVGFCGLFGFLRVASEL